MIFMKKLLLVPIFALLALFNVHAQTINAIAIVVNGEPITTSEIQAISQQMKKSQIEARNMLISDRLQKAAMKDTLVSELELHNRIKAVAAQNSMSVEQLQDAIAKDGMFWSSYTKQLKDSMKKAKFYQEKIFSTIVPPSMDELKEFYELHKSAFSTPERIELVEYTGTQEAIANLLQNGDESAVASTAMTQDTKDINPDLLAMYLQTRDGSFTQPLNTGSGLAVFKVISKSGLVTAGFEAIKRKVAMQWDKLEKEKAVENYFEKLRTSASIEFIR